MTVPVFEEYEPPGECGCAGCADRRRTAALPPRAGGHPAAHGARRALVLATAAGVVLGAGTAAATVRAPGPETGHDRAASGGDAVGLDTGPATEQGATGALHGSGAVPPDEPPPRKLRPMTRADIINRAKKWVTAQVPYSMEKYWSDGYRQDCSGFVSMAWNLGTNEWTGSLDAFAVRIAREELQPGDILLFHNPDNPTRGSHVVIFGGWTDYTHTYYVAYEQTPPLVRKQATPYGYWSNSSRYLPYRYKGLSTGAGGPAVEPPAAPAALAVAFPGAGAFGPGADNAYVTRLGQMLVARGGKRFYTEGPGPRWGAADRRATQAFQRAQGWTGRSADGLPGAETWSLLVRGAGKDIPPAGGVTAPAATTPPQPPAQVPAAQVPTAPAPTAPAPTAPAPTAPAPTAQPAAPQPPAPPAQGPPGPLGAPGAPAGPTVAAQAGRVRVPVFPGRAYFRPGQSSAYVTELGRQLLRKGFGRYYTAGPGPRWSEADRRNVEAFQRAQGWRGGAADGYPGPETWRRLFPKLSPPSSQLRSSREGPPPFEQGRPQS
ncbi:peptidoglycan-binding protein [Streptomyces sp. BPTC-684]|uniref:peptidoglycan-binding protein n=1 Tax=Streptomyces sp. BPTC-684 TaxID=3043734 RepID=UPI0024B17EED|nr:peptidoglycan-binding protein [Streptomyces sp. BPTC-684]WHM38595.1 peptidoglycan-binding protein [Streptomyces sp. BPTC-684]